MQLIQAIPLIWKQKLNDGEKMLKKVCRTRPSPNKKH